MIWDSHLHGQKSAIIAWPQCVFYAINNRRMFCAWILTSVSLVRYVTWLNILQEKPVFLPNKVSKWVLQIYGHNLQTPPATSNLNRTETTHIWKLFFWSFLTKNLKGLNVPWSCLWLIISVCTPIGVIKKQPKTALVARFSVPRPPLKEGS